MNPRNSGAWALVALATLLVGGAYAPASEPPDPRGAIFVRRGCNDCHAITGLGVKASADVGPDLTFAYGDVVIRYGVNLESFMAAPSGVMRLMLASHLHLRVSERDSMVQALKDLYAERRAQLQDGPMDGPAAGTEPAVMRGYGARVRP